MIDRSTVVRADGGRANLRARPADLDYPLRPITYLLAAYLSMAAEVLAENQTGLRQDGRARLSPLIGNQCDAE